MRLARNFVLLWVFLVVANALGPWLNDTTTWTDVIERSWFQGWAVGLAWFVGQAEIVRAQVK